MTMRYRPSPSAFSATVRPLPARHVPPAAATANAGLALTPREAQGYSLTRALSAAASGSRSGFEFDVSDEFARKAGRTPRSEFSFFLPLSLRTQLSTGASTKGSELRGTTLQPTLIELLRNRSLAISTLGARFVSGLTGNIAMPRQTAAATAGWVQEAPGADLALSSLSLDQVTLSPKTLQASTSVSRQLLNQSTPAISDVLFMDLMQQHAVAIDAAVFYGPGGGTQPTGVGVVSGTNLVAMGANGGQITLAKFFEGMRVLEQANAMTDRSVFVTTPGIKYSAAGVVRFAGTDSRSVWDLDQGLIGGMAGYTSNNLPTNLVKGTSGAVCHAAIMGDFGNVMIGEWGAGLEIIVDPFTLARRNLLQVTSLQFVDVQVTMPNAFAVYRDLLV